MEAMTIEDLAKCDVSSDTDPKTLETVGEAVLYILRSNNLDISLPEFIENTEHVHKAEGADWMNKELILQIFSREVIPGSIILFDPNSKNYARDLRRKNTEAAKKISTHYVSTQARDLSLIFCKGIAGHYSTFSVINPEKCVESTYQGRVHMVKNSLKEPILQKMSIAPLTCKKSRICNSVIGSVSEYHEKPIDENTTFFG